MLHELVTPETAGDPMSQQKWIRSSLRHLSTALTKRGHPVCPMTVRRLLRQQDYSLQANVKRLAGTEHPDRNTQFEYLESLTTLFLKNGWPVISVDTKKKELIGNFKNRGQGWYQQAEVVKDHDFEHEALGKAVPYGLYVLNHNRGYVYVGQSADTAEFAVDSIQQWWTMFGQFDFPHAPSLLILCDGGGSNSWRSRLWKVQLQDQLADPFHLEVSVSHYPTGASKWNPIEHRLFGPMSINWTSIPLRTFETMLATIRGTTTRTGLEVKAFLVEHVYERGRKIAEAVMQSLNLRHHDTCPNWNYTISPRSTLGTVEIGC